MPCVSPISPIGKDYEKLGLATALLLAMTGAQAYQFEVQGQSEYIDTTENDKDFTGGLQGTFYFKNVDSSKDYFG